MLQFSVALRNARADQVTSAAGAGALLRLFTGAAPANCAAAASGTLLSAHTCTTPLAPAAAGGILSPSLPPNATAVATGVAGHWRLYKSDGVTCVAQGTAGTSAADLILQTTSVVSGAKVQINSWSWLEGAG